MTYSRPHGPRASWTGPHGQDLMAKGLMAKGIMAKGLIAKGLMARAPWPRASWPGSATVEKIVSPTKIYLLQVTFFRSPETGGDYFGMIVSRK